MFSLFLYVYLFVHMLEGHGLILQCEVLAEDCETATKFPQNVDVYYASCPNMGDLLRRCNTSPPLFWRNACMCGPCAWKPIYLFFVASQMQCTVTSCMSVSKITDVTQTTTKNLAGVAIENPKGTGRVALYEKREHDVLQREGVSLLWTMRAFLFITKQCRQCVGCCSAPMMSRSCVLIAGNRQEGKTGHWGVVTRNQVLAPISLVAAMLGQARVPHVEYFPQQSHARTPA